MSDFAQTLLEVSLTGFIVFRPVYEAAETAIQDFAYVQLNPAAQQLLQLPERPAESFLTLYPTARHTGIFAFYCAAFASDQTERYQVDYQHDGLNGYFLLVARRSGEHLVVSFTDTNDQPRSAVEEALRQSQAREQAARVEAECQRQQLQALVDQSPVAIGYFEGPELRVTAANPLLSAMWGRQQAQVLGRPLLEGVPELAGQGFEELMRQVRETGVPFVGTEAPAQMLRDGRLTTTYYNFVYQPLYDAQGTALGVIDVAVEVTEQVRARQQVQALNEELAALNEELRASNEGYQLANAALSETQQQLQGLNAELENRVQQRTQELAASHQAAEALQADLLAAAQRQVQQRQELYQIVAQTPVAIVLLREPDHRIEYHNPAFEALFPPEQGPGGSLQGYLLGQVYPRLQEAGLVALLDEVFRTGESRTLIDLPLADLQPGSPRFVTFAYQAYHEEDRIVGVTAFVYDTTEQVRARRTGEDAARQLRLLTDALPVLISYVDRDRRYQFANRAYQAWFGHTPAELQGRLVREVVGEAAYAATQGYMDRVLAGEPLRFEARMPYRADFVKYIQTNFIPDEQHGEVRGYYSLVSDVTDQVLARQQVQQLNQELSATNAELHQSNTRLTRTNADLDNFIYTASHDLKTPIANIEGLLRLLEELLPTAVRQDEVIRPVLSRMQDAVERFRRTIGHLTDVSKLQAEFTQPAEVVSLARVIEEVHQDLWPQFTEAGARLEVNVDDARPRVFSPKNLRSLVYNLVSNAVKYRHPARPVLVRIRCVPAGDALVLTVQDNGLGLSGPQQKRLFQLFQRLHTHVEGTGVGLYTVKKIVENAGGTITVASQEGTGTTFTLTFPA